MSAGLVIFVIVVDCDVFAVKHYRIKNYPTSNKIYFPDKKSDINWFLMQFKFSLLLFEIQKNPEYERPVFEN